MTRLYLITPPAIDLTTFPASLEAAFAGGDIGAVQLRLKEVDDATILAASRALQPMCAAHGAAFILNDRPDLAAEVRADGVHLGQDDLLNWPIPRIRALIGEEAVIGVSCHDSMHLAMEAGEQEADYVAFGAFYPTKSKNAEYLARYGTPTPELLTWWSKHTVLPSVAIGGMTPANCGPLVAAGADFIAVITAVWEHPAGPDVAVAEFNEAIRKATT